MPTGCTWITVALSPLEHDAGQPAGSIGAGVDADPIGPKGDLLRWRMTVDHHGAEHSASLFKIPT